MILIAAKKKNTCEYAARRPVVLPAKVAPAAAASYNRMGAAARRMNKSFKRVFQNLGRMARGLCALSES
jgi:hypothetical protein